MRLIKDNRLLWLAILAYFVIFAGLSALRHYQFLTQTWDMGVFQQTFWNTIHGRIMTNSIEEVPNHLGVHMSPWLLALVPGYVLFQSPYYLLLVQTLALALGAWPLYLLAWRVLGEKKWALVIAAGYLLYPSLQWVNLFDFHEIPFFVPLMLAALYFLETGKRGWAALFLALSASVEENAIIAVMFVGIYLLLRRGQRKFGLGIIILSAIYFLLAVKVFMPALGGGLLRLDRFANFGQTTGEIITNILTNPALVFRVIFTAPKLWYLLWIFLPAGFLPLISARSMILLVPGLAQNLLTLYEGQFSSFYQYDAILIPGIWFGAVFGLKFFLEKFPRKKNLVFAGLVSVMIVSFGFRSPFNSANYNEDFKLPRLFRSTPRSSAFRQLVQLVPPDVSVAAHTHAVPHLANRRQVNMLGRESASADILIADLADPHGFPDFPSFQKYLDSYAETGRYQVKAIGERYVILLRSDL